MLAVLVINLALPLLAISIFKPKVAVKKFEAARENRTIN